MISIKDVPNRYKITGENFISLLIHNRRENFNMSNLVCVYKYLVESNNIFNIR